jgi:hypothetical protein
MPVLMSHSQAVKLAAQLRRTEPGLVRIGVRSGAMYVEQKPTGARDWVATWQDEPSKLSAPMDTMETWQAWLETEGAQR